VKPEIETDRLFMRPPIESDFEPWASLDASEQSTKFIGGIRNRIDAWLGMAATAGMWRLKGCGLFSVIEKSSGAWIGRIGPWVPEGAIGNEIGWALLPSVWCRGYATEGATAAIGWAFANLGWKDVIHCIHRENTASVAVAERIGSNWIRADCLSDGSKTEVYGQTRINSSVI
jgi:RimJ/RimL family protein N-acetyltransferase